MMKYRITPQLITFTYEALLKSFWRKNALKKFLQGCGIPEVLLNSWNNEESKRTFLDRTFERLQKDEDSKVSILRLALALSEQTSFPDLRNWEDSEQKIREAHLAVAELGDYLEKQNVEITTEEKKAEARKKAVEESIKIQKEIGDKEKLKTEFEKLSLKIGAQEAGYRFQVWFYKLIDFCEIENKKPYSIDGRQIDGSITLDGTTYLVELKFKTEQSPATDVDSLKAKIVKMADNTMGILLAVSGFSSVAISEASCDKTPLLLMDASHLFYYLTGVMDMKDIIRRIRRHASQTGKAYLSVEDFSK
ncbi:MAG: hypothetical protein ABFC84_09770 [Veillonellales bacterium]